MRKFVALGVVTMFSVLFQQPSHAQSPVLPIDACTKTSADIFRESSRSVVFISVKSINPYRLRDRVQSGLGSGFIFDVAGLILTNAHVVQGAQFISVRLDDGTDLPAELVGIDPTFDIAVLRIKPDAKTKIRAVPLGNSDRAKVGDTVTAIGNPLGLEQTVTQGIISAINRVLPETSLSTSRNMIQTDAAINPGNSGGPLFNCRGEVIGINTSGILQAQNLSFSIPINLVKEALPPLLKKGRLIRPWVGFHGRFIDQDVVGFLRLPLVPGLLVEVIEPGGPAEKAGIRGGTLDVSIAGDEYLLGGDIVTKINDEKIDSPGALRAAMRKLQVGNNIRLTISRRGEGKNFKYKLPERPPLPSDIPN